MDFRDWVNAQVGASQAARISRAAEILGVPDRTVSAWYYLQKAPHPKTAGVIILRTGNTVDYNGIYGPYVSRLTAGKT